MDTITPLIWQELDRLVSARYESPGDLVNFAGDAREQHWLVLFDEIYRNVSSKYAGRDELALEFL